MGDAFVNETHPNGARLPEALGLLLNPRAPETVAALQKSAWEKFSSERPEVFEGAIGISTSGSTSGGLGSIIVLKKAAIETSARAVNRRLQAQAQDVWGLALPLFHVGGYSIPVRARLSGSRVASFDGDWSAVKFHQWLDAERVTLLSLVPTQVFDLVEAGLSSPPTLRAIVVGGGRLSEELHVKARALGWPVLQSYGMTECCSQISTAPLESDGRLLEVLDHVEVRNDETSVLWIRSQALLKARIVFDSERVAQLEEPVDREGWFQTSDRVSILRLGDSDRARNILQILGRDGETVKVMGELVDLARVRALAEATVIREERFKELRNRVWVLAVPEARREHEIVLVIERPDATEDRTSPLEKDLLESLSNQLAPFEKPTRIFGTSKIPRSSLGKVLSTLLTDQVLRQ